LPQESSEDSTDSAGRLAEGLDHGRHVLAVTAAEQVPEDDVGCRRLCPRVKLLAMGDEHPDKATASEDTAPGGEELAARISSHEVRPVVARDASTEDCSTPI
jgi:hypothetical protein